MVVVRNHLCLKWLNEFTYLSRKRPEVKKWFWIILCRERIIEYRLGVTASPGPLINLTTETFVKSVGARTSAPGGGSVAALLASLVSSCWFNVRWVGMLLVSRSGLVEEDVVEVFHYYGFHLFSFYWCTISTLFRENNNLAVFPFPYHIFMPLANLWFIRLQG